MLGAMVREQLRDLALTWWCLPQTCPTWYVQELCRLSGLLTRSNLGNSMHFVSVCARACLVSAEVQRAMQAFSSSAHLPPVCHEPVTFLVPMNSALFHFGIHLALPKASVVGGGPATTIKGRHPSKRSPFHAVLSTSEGRR